MWFLYTEILFLLYWGLVGSTINTILRVSNFKIILYYVLLDINTIQKNGNVLIFNKSFVYSDKKCIT